MARGRKKGRTNSRRPRTALNRPATIAAPNPEKFPADVLQQIESAAAASATTADVEAANAAPAPDEDLRAEDLIKRATKARELLEVQRKRHIAAEEAAQSQKAEFDQCVQTLQKEKETLGVRQRELDKMEVVLKQRTLRVDDDEAELLTRREDIIRRELDADTGFMKRNKEALAGLEAEGEELRAQFSRHRQRITEERAAFERDLSDESEKLERELADRRKEAEDETVAARSTLSREVAESHANIRREREEVQAERKRLRKDAREIELDQELLQEDREATNEKVAVLAAREIEHKCGEIQALTDRLDAARNERDSLFQRLAKREEADRRFGEETAEDVICRLQALEQERDKLRDVLGERPSADAAQRLADLERQKELWESDRLQYVAHLAEARQEAARRRIAVTEMEALRDEKRSLESANALLHEANQQLREEVDGLVKRAEGKNPFPSCSAMHSKSDLQTMQPTRDAIDHLDLLADDVRHRMVWDPGSEKELYYSARDVRSCLGGLAMSRLHLLQGISGTGKTSLPLAFARAIGAGSHLVEVQAGWRDRQDLIGHFNTFERRFYESEFLQAMYRASCPRYRDTPFIVVLDEMNLSHPEQYFADMLSALELDQHRQRLVLMTAPVESAPKLLVDGGTKLPIPPNIWFVGTANHDETTRDFADKTYDRAHVLELPRHREEFARRDVRSQQPVSIDALTNAFEKAMKDHEEDTSTAYQFLQEHLREVLGRRFRVGWGNRLERQMNRYVPVVIAAGGSVGEAMDHILATKILRKIRDRHDNRPEDIINLRDQIQAGWEKLDGKGSPDLSLSLLKDELHRLGRDDD